MLSVLDSRIFSQMSKFRAAVSRWRRLPTSLRSELVRLPLGLAVLTSCLEIDVGKVVRQRSGGGPGFWVLAGDVLAGCGTVAGQGSHTPPAPWPEAL